MQGVGVWIGRMLAAVAALWAVTALGSAAPDAKISAEVLAATEVAHQLPSTTGTSTTLPSTTEPPTTAPPNTAAPTSVAATSSTAVVASSTTAAPPPTTAFASTTTTPSSTTALGPTRSLETSTTTVAAAPRLTRDEMGRQALARMRFDVNTHFPAWQVTFEGPRSGLRALTYPGDHRIVVYVRDSDSVASLHRVLAHEFGHVADLERFSETDRRRWRQQRGIGDGTPWWPGEAAPDFSTGAGDLAEAFAVWETGVRSQSNVAGQPDAEDLAVLVELLG